MREQVLKKLYDLKTKYTRLGVETSFVGTKTAIFTYTKNDVRVTMRLYSEPVETSYFNVDATVEIEGVCYLYNGSEREYEGMAQEISTLDGIVGHALDHKYKLVKRKVFFFWKNTYMQIIFDDLDVELLKIKCTNV